MADIPDLPDMANIITYHDCVKRRYALEEEERKMKSRLDLYLCDEDFKDFWKDEAELELPTRIFLQKDDAEEEVLSQEPKDPWEEIVEPLPFTLTPRQYLPYENGINDYWCARGIIGIRVKKIERKISGSLYRMEGECPIHNREHMNNHWIMWAHVDKKKMDYYSCHHGNFEINKRFLDINVYEMEA